MKNKRQIEGLPEITAFDYSIASLFVFALIGMILTIAILSAFVS